MAENTNKPQTPPDPPPTEEKNTETSQGRTAKTTRKSRPRYSESDQKAESKERYSNA